MDIHSDASAELRAYNSQVQSVLEAIDTPTIAKHLIEVAVRAFEAESGAVFVGANGAGAPTYTVGKWKGESALEMAIGPEGGNALMRIALGPREDGRAYTEEDCAMLEKNLVAVRQALALAEKNKTLS